MLNPVSPWELLWATRDRCTALMIRLSKRQGCHLGDLHHRLGSEYTNFVGCEGCKT